MKRNAAQNKRMPIFMERFRELQGERSNTEFAEFLGISRQTVGFYCNGDRIPDAYMLRYIAEKCNVSSDWLIGLSEVKVINEDVERICKYLGLSETAVKSLKKLSAKEIMNVFSDMKDPELHVFPTDGISKIVSNDSFYNAILLISKAISYKCISTEVGEYKSQITGEIAVDVSNDHLIHQRFKVLGEAGKVGMVALPALMASNFYVNEAAKEFRIAVEQMVNQLAYDNKTAPDAANTRDGQKGSKP